MRVEALPSNLRFGKVVTFWKEVKVMAGRGKKITQSVDGISGEDNITKM